MNFNKMDNLNRDFVNFCTKGCMIVAGRKKTSDAVKNNKVKKERKTPAKDSTVKKESKTSVTEENKVIDTEKVNKEVTEVNVEANDREKKEVTEVKAVELKKIGTEQHSLVKDSPLTLCISADTVKVTIKNIGGGDVVIQSPIKIKLYVGSSVDINSNENIVLSSRSYPKVSVTYWR